MEVCVLASGSSGNACLVRDGDSLMLVDAGLSGRALAEAITAVGHDPREVAAIWLTHEHGDHVRGAGAFAKRFGTPVLATAGTLDGARGVLKGVATQAIEPGRQRFAGLMVTAVPIPHDTRGPVCYRFDGPGGAAAVATDMGRLDMDVLAALEGVDTLVWESNYDTTMLWNGPYPERLKARIAGGRGHLANHLSASGLRQLCRGGMSQVVLAHLSEQNNDPDLALAATETALSTVRRAPQIHVAKRHEPTGWIGAEPPAPKRGEQLSLLEWS